MYPINCHHCVISIYNVYFYCMWLRSITHSPVAQPWWVMKLLIGMSVGLVISYRKVILLLTLLLLILLFWKPTIYQKYKIWDTTSKLKVLLSRNDPTYKTYKMMHISHDLISINLHIFKNQHFKHKISKPISIQLETTPWYDYRDILITQNCLLVPEIFTYKVYEYAMS